VLTSVMKLLKALGLWHQRMNVGVARRGEQRVRFGVPGCGDLLVLISRDELPGLPGARTQVALWVETKSERGRQSREQRLFQSVVENEGHCYVMVRSAHELYAWLRLHNLRG
jgi:hypothetical protein